MKRNKEWQEVSATELCERKKSQTKGNNKHNRKLMKK